MAVAGGDGDERVGADHVIRGIIRLVVGAGAAGEAVLPELAVAGRGHDKVIIEGGAEDRVGEGLTADGNAPAMVGDLRRCRLRS